MLTNEQLQEIREHLEKAQNPVFFFDNDIDGLISFILLRRKIDRGKGVAIKSFPELDASYIKRVDELNSDYIFILDKPLVSDEFIEESKKRNIPLVWIDHHEPNIKIKNDLLFHYYNPFFSDKKDEIPTSYICYEAVRRKEDLWFAMAGCLGDNYMPYFSEEFSKKYPELWSKDVKSAFQALYETEFGKLIIILGFALKDRTTNVISMINYLFKVRHPSDILVENQENSKILRRYEQVKKSYLKLLEKAKYIARSGRKVIFFQYGGDMSLSADLANELHYRFPGKVILVAYLKGNIANISVRGKEDVRKVTLKAVKQIDNATGGGHKNATGAKVMVEDLKKFVKVFEEEFD